MIVLKTRFMASTGIASAVFPGVSSKDRHVDGLPLPAKTIHHALSNAIQTAQASTSHTVRGGRSGTLDQEVPRI